jgi:hypothetical protein
MPNTMSDFKEPNCSPELLMNKQPDSVQYFFLIKVHSQLG